jgi:iron complex outermembrane receptor protein
MKSLLTATSLCALLIVSVAKIGWSDDSKSDLIPFENLRQLDLETLMEIDVVVTSAAKKSQQLSETAAAVFVITPEDLRRSGVTTIAEALRMVPGMQVAHIDANKWAISSRGFNGRFANKLLILMDGRTVYTPLFSGVFWDEQDTLLEDIARIEVIRGPGAALWGANAINGVVNIITKRADETQGTLFEAGAGTEERGFGAVRYGGKLAEEAYYRIYAKYFKRDNFVLPVSGDTTDDWGVRRGGFRLDWKTVSQDALTLQGDIYDGKAGQSITTLAFSPPFAQTVSNDINFAGKNILGRWRHRLSKTSDLDLQIYYDRTERNNPSLGKQTLDTVDVDLQHHLRFGKRHEIDWGLGYRFNHSDTRGTFELALDPANRSQSLFSAFIQDEITLVDDKLRLTLGSKFEHNDFSGFEVQPNARLLWRPHDRHTVWTAISRAVRTPSYFENDVRFNERILANNPLAVVSLFGDENFDSEELLAFELGYRIQPMDRLFVDIAAFYNIYGRLRTFEPQMSFQEISSLPSHLVQPFVAGNKMEGETYGVEWIADWKPWDAWRLQIAYSFLQIALHLDEDSGDTMAEDAEGENPEHQLSLRSSWDLLPNLDFDLWLRYVDNLPSLGIESYVMLDARLAWRPHKNWELSIVGQNLLDAQHNEFKPEFGKVLATEVQRGVYGKVRWNY